MKFDLNNKVAGAFIAVMAMTSSLALAEAATSKLPELYEAPSFQLTDQNAKPFDSAILKGKVWVIDFKFTSCPHECPLMTAAMQNVQRHVKDVKDVYFVSITTDPKTDTSKVLKKYMTSRKIDESNWSFLTGDKKKIVDIAKKGFKLPADEKKASHSEKFALVDRTGKVRGYYESASAEDMKKLQSDIRTL